MQSVLIKLMINKAKQKMIEGEKEETLCNGINIKVVLT